MNRYGLTILRERRTLAYGLDHGLGLHWMPDWMQSAIVFVWNKTYCAIWGHDETMVGIVKDPSCVDCCKPLRRIRFASAKQARRAGAEVLKRYGPVFKMLSDDRMKD